LSERVASINSALRDLWDAHLRENDGEPLPHLYLGEVAEWFVQPAKTGVPMDNDRRALCAVLEDALRVGASDVRELVQVSFTENLPIDVSAWLLPCFGHALTQDFERYRGRAH